MRRQKRRSELPLSPISTHGHSYAPTTVSKNCCVLRVKKSCKSALSSSQGCWIYKAPLIPGLKDAILAQWLVSLQIEFQVASSNLVPPFLSWLPHENGKLHKITMLESGLLFSEINIGFLKDHSKSAMRSVVVGKKVILGSGRQIDDGAW